MYIYTFGLRSVGVCGKMLACMEKCRGMGPKNGGTGIRKGITLILMGLYICTVVFLVASLSC